MVEEHAEEQSTEEIAENEEMAPEDSIELETGGELPVEDAPEHEPAQSAEADEEVGMAEQDEARLGDEEDVLDEEEPEALEQDPEIEAAEPDEPVAELEPELVVEEVPAEIEVAPVEDEVSGDDLADDESAAEVETEEEGSSEVPSAAVEDDRHWYVVHCYSGYENKVRHNLEQRIDTMGMKSKIFDVVVPTEEEIEVKDGKRRTVERRVFPGYILVQMMMDEDSWYVVRNTPGVTGFVGMGNDPTPLRQEEVAQIVKRMEADAPRIKVTYKTGQKVRIIDGPFNDFIGTVADIDMERAKVRVMVSFFGRETPVELDFLQVEKA